MKRILGLIVFSIFMLSSMCFAQTAEEARISMGKMNIPYSEKTFFEAISNNDQMALDLFLDAGMNANLLTDNGSSPLVISANRGKKDLIEKLIAHGADVNLALPNNVTPLKTAVFYNNIEAVKIFLAHDAKIDVRNNQGENALDIALSKGHKEIAQLLEDKLPSILTDAQINKAIIVGYEAAQNKQDIVYTEMDTDKSYGGFLGSDLKTAGRAYYISPFCVVANEALQAKKTYSNIENVKYNMLSRYLQMRFVFTFPAGQFNYQELTNMTLVLLQNGKVSKPVKVVLSNPQVTTKNYFIAISIQAATGLIATFDANEIDFKAPFEVKAISKSSKELTFKFNLQNHQPEYNQTKTDEYKW